MNIKLAIKTNDKENCEFEYTYDSPFFVFDEQNECFFNVEEGDIEEYKDTLLFCFSEEERKGYVNTYNLDSNANDSLNANAVNYVELVNKRDLVEKQLEVLNNSILNSKKNVMILNKLFSLKAEKMIHLFKTAVSPRLEERERSIVLYSGQENTPVASIATGV